MKKKSILAAAIAACAMAFTACDPDQLINDAKNMASGAMGSIELIASNVQGDQYCHNGDSLKFGASLCGVLENDHPSTLYVGTPNDLLKGDLATISFPLSGMNLSGAPLGRHEVAFPFPLDDIQQLLDIDWEALLVEENTDRKIFLVVCDSNAAYVGVSGDVTITSFDTVGSKVTGTVNNVLAYYVNEAKINEIKDLIDRAEAYDMQAMQQLQAYQESEWRDFFATVVFNGTVASRHADIAAIVKALKK